MEERVGADGTHVELPAGSKDGLFEGGKDGAEEGFGRARRVAVFEEREEGGGEGGGEVGEEGGVGCSDDPGSHGEEGGSKGGVDGGRGDVGQDDGEVGDEGVGRGEGEEGLEGGDGVVGGWERDGECVEDAEDEDGDHVVCQTLWRGEERGEEGGGGGKEDVLGADDGHPGECGEDGVEARVDLCREEAGREGRNGREDGKDGGQEAGELMEGGDVESRGEGFGETVAEGRDVGEEEAGKLGLGHAVCQLESELDELWDDSGEGVGLVCGHGGEERTEHGDDGRVGLTLLEEREELEKEGGDQVVPSHDVWPRREVGKHDVGLVL